MRECDVVVVVRKCGVSGVCVCVCVSVCVSVVCAIENPQPCVQNRNNSSRVLHLQMEHEHPGRGHFRHQTIPMDAAKHKGVGVGHGVSGRNHAASL